MIKQNSFLKISILYFFVCLLLVTMGCGPTTFTKTRISWEPYSQKELKQTKKGITIEQHFLNNWPPEFMANIQQCETSTGKLYVDSNRNPIMEKTSILPENAWLEKVSITNNTGHILRLNMTAIALFDPADNQYDLLSKDEIASYLMQERPCTNTIRLVNQLNTVKLIGRNTELLPNRTYTGYLVFLPHDASLQGIWKLSLYELPVETNTAGIVTKTVNFEFRTLSKKYVDTYRRESPFADAVKISSEEVK